MAMVSDRVELSAPAKEIGVQPTIGVGMRLVAAIIDLVIYFLFAWLLAAATGGLTQSGFELTGAPALVSFLAVAVYFIGMEKLFGGTVGKLVLGLRVVTLDLHPISWSQSLIRNLLRIVDFLPFFYIVGAIAIWMSKDHQRLGDRVAGTVIVKRMH
jgi:uncharacterized RDD family membrane protein YckC